MLPKAITDDPRYAGRLLEIKAPEDIPDRWKGTPIQSFVLSQNFAVPITGTGTPELLITTCIEFRYALPIPRMFAYVIRRASGRLYGSEFSLAYILSRGVRHICLVGHNDCGMTKIEENKESMINALVEQGWHKDCASEFINMQASRYAMSDEIDALKAEYTRLRRLFKRVEIAPFLVCLSAAKLYIPNWYFELDEKQMTNRADVADDDIVLFS